jgi:hypothetical protein
MTPARQSAFANFIMVTGATPFLAMVGWTIAILSLNVRGQPPRIFMLDPIGMIGLIIVAYACSLLFAGIGMWWSFAVSRSHPQILSTKIKCLRILVGLTLGSPLLMILPGYLSRIMS